VKLMDEHLLHVEQSLAFERTIPHPRHRTGPRMNTERGAEPTPSPSRPTAGSTRAAGPGASGIYDSTAAIRATSPATAASRRTRSGRARRAFAVQFVLNYEEGRREQRAARDAGSEQFLSEMFNPPRTPSAT
jgi:hypothetical protein